MGIDAKTDAGLTRRPPRSDASDFERLQKLTPCIQATDRIFARGNQAWPTSRSAA